MIGRLKGEIIEKQPPLLVIDVAGVGYEVLAPMSTFYNLPAAGTTILHTHLSITENSHQLFGFASQRERSLFRQLIKVSGVGPKMGLAVLSSMDPDEVVAAILNDNVSALTKVPGVGKKMAERLVIEMRDRLKDWQLPSAQQAQGNSTQLAKPSSIMLAEAESAMIALGYKPAEAAKAINGVIKNNEINRSEELIRLALRSMLPAI